MPHELAAWCTHDKRYWSQYSADSRTRRCWTHAPVPVDDTCRRAIRIFGSRKTVLRDDNDSRCWFPFNLSLLIFHVVTDSAAPPLGLTRGPSDS